MTHLKITVRVLSKPGFIMNRHA